MIVDEITSLEELDSIRDEWSSLFLRCPAATPFQSPEWLVPWWRHLGGGDLLVLAVREAGRLVGLAQLFLWGTANQIRRISMLGAGVTDYLDFVLEPACAQETARNLLDYLSAAHHQWAVCQFDDVPADSLLAGAEHAELVRTVEEGSQCPVLELPDSWEELLASVPAGFRRSLHKARRRLNALGNVHVEVADRTTLEAARGALFELHRQRWNRRGETGVLGDPRLWQFHSEVMSGMLECGRLRLYHVRSDGRTAAVTYCLAHNNRTYAYLSGFDPALEGFRPGAVALAFAVEHAIREGMTEFDFLRGREAYKYRWGALDRPNLRITFRRATPLN